jgi:hypothetical protein
LLTYQCTEKGLKNLTQAFRSAQKKLMESDEGYGDSGIGMSEPDDVLVSDTHFGDYPSTMPRIPSIQSMLHPMAFPPGHITDSFQKLSNAATKSPTAHPIKKMESQPSTRASPKDHLDFLGRNRPTSTKDMSTITAYGTTLQGHPQTLRQSPVYHHPRAIVPPEESNVTDLAVYTRLFNSEDCQYLATSAASEISERNDVSTTSEYLESEGLNSAQSSSDDSSADCVDDIAIQKQLMVDRLMVCFYDMFTLTEFTTCNGDASPSSNDSPNGGAVATGRGARGNGKKRKSDERRDDNEPNSEDENGAGKRQRTQDRSVAQDHKVDSHVLITSGILSDIDHPEHALAIGGLMFTGSSMNFS